MEKKLVKQFDFQSGSLNEEERSIIITASTNQIDRYGDIIEPTAFQLEKIKTLPILFNHNPNQAVGKTLWAKITNNALLLKIYISNKTQLAKDVFELVKEGIINFASVGFVPEEYEQIEGGYKFTKVDLLETSLTPTPANPGAIALMMKNIQSPEIKNIFEKNILENEIKELKSIKDIFEIELQTLKVNYEELSEKYEDVLKLVAENKNELEILKKELFKNKNTEDINKQIDTILFRKLNEILGK